MVLQSAVRSVWLVVVVSLALTACFGSSGGDREEWEEFDTLSSGQVIAITDSWPPERLTGDDTGMVLELSAGWAEAFGTETEIPFEKASIRVFVTFSTDTQKWCDLGEMAVRDDWTGERHVFLNSGDCISKGGDLQIRGIFDDDEPLGYR